MTEFKLACGAVVLIDDEDVRILKAYHWSLSHYGYVVRYEGSSRQRTQKVIFLHKEFVPSNRRVDHRDRNKLNNQRHNLRFATPRQNAQNMSKHRGSSSRFKGVFWFKRDSKWAAQICINGKRTHIGYFDDEIEAAKAYDKEALKHFGEFAAVNGV